MTHGFGGMGLGIWMLILGGFSAVLPASARAESGKDPAEWTVLVFLNGNNDLDPFGAGDLREMEKVGSTDQVQVVVQWASFEAKKTRRLRVEKARPGSTGVTSPILEDLGLVDMGDWKNLVEFVRWGVDRYPAKRYFVVIWNHGMGWLSNEGTGFSAQDISYDDLSHNKITTEQLGLAMGQIASILGRPIDLYGSDACLMNGLEVAAEIAPHAGTMVGSQADEPGDGWPYDAWLKRLVAQPTMGPHDLSRMMVEEYDRSYGDDGSQGFNERVTQSALDLTQLDALAVAVADLRVSLLALPGATRAAMTDTLLFTQRFDVRSYADLGDLMDRLSRKGPPELAPAIRKVRDGLKAMVLSTRAGDWYGTRAQGVSIWLPPELGQLQESVARYRGLRWNAATAWADALEALPIPDSTR